jgi:serine O-acetyltransferase
MRNGVPEYLGERRWLPTTAPQVNPTPPTYTLWQAIKCDMDRFRGGYRAFYHLGFLALALYRAQRKAMLSQSAFAPPLRIMLKVAKKILTTITAIDIHQNCDIAPGCWIPHGCQIFIHGDTVIGRNCTIQQVVTIGVAYGGKAGARIGDDVWIGCHASVIGPVTIGNRATVAANSLVIADVPTGATAIGVPARNIPGLRPPEHQ